MRKSSLIAAVFVAASLPAAASTAAIAPAPLTALAAAQGRIAYATAWTKSSCERVVLGAASFGPRICPAVSTGRGIFFVEVAGTRALWLAYAGGNTREWSLETATATKPLERQLRFVAQDVELPAPIVLGPSDGSLLAYAVGTNVVALRANGSRAFSWSAPATVTSLAIAGGRVAVGEESGEVAIVAAGKVVRTESETAPVDAVAFSGTDVVVQVGRDIRRAAGLGPEYTDHVAKGAHLEDADARRAVYVAGGRAHLLDLAAATDRVVGPAEHAAIDANRLVLANGRSVVSRTL